MSGITVVLGFLLSLAATSLKDRQDFNVEIDRKRNILKSLNIPEDASRVLTPTEIETLFDEKVITIFINEDGAVSEDGTMPLYIKSTNGVNEGYSIPVSGKGLWSTIYGYLAIEPDGKTVKGLTFYKHGETPGLGGEVEKEWFTSNFVGKQIVNPSGELIGIQVIKGQVDPEDSEAYHKVDGISGATMTTKGLNKFLIADLESYNPFFENLRGAGE
jgi:Na+-transporting NADH:ubiquinone oxidoreductase subunit C